MILVYVVREGGAERLAGDVVDAVGGEDQVGSGSGESLQERCL